MRSDAGASRHIGRGKYYSIKDKNTPESRPKRSRSRSKSRPSISRSQQEALFDCQKENCFICLKDHGFGHGKYNTNCRCVHKCKHFFCILLAYVVISAGVKADYTDTAVDESAEQTGIIGLGLHIPRKNSTSDQSRIFLDQDLSHKKGRSVPVFAESQLHSFSYVPELKELNAHQAAWSDRVKSMNSELVGRDIPYNLDSRLNNNVDRRMSTGKHYRHRRQTLRSETSLEAEHLPPQNVNLDLQLLPVKEESKFFISRLFHRYGNEAYLSIEDFREVLRNIGLIAVLNDTDNRDQEDNIPETYHKDDHHHLNENSGPAHHSSGKEDYESQSHEFLHHDGNDTENTLHMTPFRQSSNADLVNQSLQEKTNSSSREKLETLPRFKRHEIEHLPEQLSQCMSLEQLLKFFKLEATTILTEEDFWHVCPALIDQLDNGYCHQVLDGAHHNKHKGDVHSDNTGHTHDHDHIHDHDHNHDHDIHLKDNHDHNHTQSSKKGSLKERDPVKVWAYTFLAVTVISICSVAGVLVIPSMKRVIYNHTLQFMVALAVGTMSGDAMLHLLPHALAPDSHGPTPHSHSNNTDGEKGRTHQDAVYKGLVALMGIYGFFFLERLLTMFTSARSKKEKLKQKRKRMSGSEGRLSFQVVSSNLEINRDLQSCEETVMVVHPNKALKAYADVSHEALLHTCDESPVSIDVHNLSTPIVKPHGATGDGHTTELEVETILHNDHSMPGNGDACRAVAVEELDGSRPNGKAKGHGHSHSHLLQGESLSSVAMMVLMGDLVHNFCDGLAIGAAFSGSLAGGFSTSVAIFCHELPHEIGDFAVLLRSGLTVKRAVCYNLLSALPCFLGAVLGILIGNLASSTAWIFAVVGGMFLYITLVDLIPDMSSVYTKCGEPWFLHLLLQACGIAVGTTLMLILSVWESSVTGA